LTIYFAIYILVGKKGIFHRIKLEIIQKYLYILWLKNKKGMKNIPFKNIGGN